MDNASALPAFRPLPDLKQRLVSILQNRALNYKALVDHLGTTEAALDKALTQNTIEIRTLELISKELRIPLYSFFREPELSETGEEVPFYNVNMWANGESQLRTENESLRVEIDRLRFELAKKELLIQGLEAQLKSET